MIDYLRFVIFELSFRFHFHTPSNGRDKNETPLTSSIELEKTEEEKKGHTAFSGLLSDDSFPPSDSDTNPNGILGCSRKPEAIFPFVVFWEL